MQSISRLMKVTDIKEVAAAAMALFSAIGTIIARPDWPTVALILMVGLMGYVIYKMILGRLEQYEASAAAMKAELGKCHEAHKECSDRFAEVLMKLTDIRGQADIPERRTNDPASVTLPPELLRRHSDPKHST